MSNDKDKEHPEVTDLKNICEVTPHSKETQKICELVKKDNQSNSTNKK